jgi:hypothetical protein
MASVAGVPQRNRGRRRHAEFVVKQMHRALPNAMWGIRDLASTRGLLLRAPVHCIQGSFATCLICAAVHEGCHRGGWLGFDDSAFPAGGIPSYMKF